MKVLVADALPAEGLAELERLGCQIVSDPQLKDQALCDAIRTHEPDVLVVRSTKVTAPMLTASTKLSLVIRAGSGFDTIDVETASTRGIRVCNCPGTNSVAVAELTLGLMIALDRRIVDETDDIRRRVWNKKEYSKARGLKGRTLGVVGLGRIGYEVAKRARAFDMRLIYTDVVVNAAAERELGIAQVPFQDLLRQADFVTLHVPGGNDTKHLIGRSELEMMKPTAFILNCARGGIIDEKALGDALRAGTIAGAALDVYEAEPAATDHEFPAAPIAPRLYCTHHVGASTEQAQLAVSEEVVRIVAACKDRGEYLNCVNAAEANGAGSRSDRTQKV